MNFDEVMESFCSPVIPQLIRTPRDKKLWKKYLCDESLSLVLEDMMKIGCSCEQANVADGTIQLAYLRYIVENTINFKSSQICIREQSDTTLSVSVGNQEEGQTPILIACSLENAPYKDAERYTSFLVGYLLLRRLWKLNARISKSVHFLFIAPDEVTQTNKARYEYIARQRERKTFIETSIIFGRVGMPQKAINEYLASLWGPRWYQPDKKLSNLLFYDYKHERWPDYGLLQSYITSAGFFPKMTLIPAKPVDSKAILSHQIENLAFFRDITQANKNSDPNRIYEPKELSFGRMDALTDVVLAYLKLEVAGYTYGRIRPPQRKSYDTLINYYKPPYTLTDDDHAFWPPTAEEQDLMTDDGRRKTKTDLSQKKGTLFGRVI